MGPTQKKGTRGMVLVTLGVLTTTAQHIQSRPAREYLGIVSGDVVVDIRRDRYRGDNLALHHGRLHALRALATCARERGATVVVGIEIEYVSIGIGTLLVTATGTAVRL